MPTSRSITRSGVFVGISWNGCPRGSCVDTGIIDASAQTKALRIYFDGVGEGLEPRAKWRMDNVCGDLINRAYNCFKAEWVRNWGRNGHIYVTIPCVILDKRYKHAEIVAILRSWGPSLVPSRDKVEEATKIAAVNTSASKDGGGSGQRGANVAHTRGGRLLFDMAGIAAKFAQVMADAMNAAEVDVEDDSVVNDA